MKILVTGSEGFIGSYVCAELKKQGYEIIYFDKKRSPNEDLLYHDLAGFVLEADAVINLAGLVGLKYCMDNPVNAVYQNVLGATRLLNAFRNSGAKLIHISTWAVEGNLVNPYDVTKLAGENMVKSYFKRGLIDGCVVRLGTAYGRGMSKLGVIPTMIKKAKLGEKLVVHGRGEQIRQFTHASDIARGIVKVLEKGKNGETYYCVADEITSVNDIAKALSEDIKYTEKREGDEEYKVIDNSKLKALGWKQEVSFKDGMEELKNG